MKKIIPFIAIIFFGLIISCKKETHNQNTNHDDHHPQSSPYNNIENTYGFNLLKRIPGIWAGPLTSTTMLGNFPEWISDLRPISAAQVSGKNELDKNNDIFLGFFISKYKNEYRLCFRNGGLFGGMSRISYFLCDSVNETSEQAYYRFSEIKKGMNRAYSEMIFVKDSLYLRSYTNKNNTQSHPVLHMNWAAKLLDTTSSHNSIQFHQFPQKVLIKDFSNTFDGLSESIFFSAGHDPYNEAAHPYLGKTHVSFTFSSTLIPDPNKNVYLLITTQPLISGMSYQPNNLKYRSRYVSVKASENTFTFNYMHPGSYYLYAFYDHDGNGTINSGDWMNGINTNFILSPKAEQNLSVNINFIIP